MHVKNNTLLRDLGLITCHRPWRQRQSRMRKVLDNPGHERNLY